MKKWLLTLLFCLISTGAFAASNSFQASITPDLAIHPRGTRIGGVSLGIWSENPQDALTLGIVNGSTGTSSGLSLGFLANYAQNYKGLQLAFLANYASGTATGVQGAAFNYATKLHGLQLGFINFADTCDKGVQIGILNIMNQTKGWFTDLPNEVAPGMVFINWRY
ncbi:hypothetical protein A7E78_10150 [Syntrophotalea acetylenivorans]|uniref:Uncharacterized protein n=1 Tax=Syntrophotalea acetylenivorans TaxID=1842532 RepID=A0A1L3GQJ5_9BACT|nr:hypothetical protein [Syntrophotalea acetylenivorans]APG28175.1 hypothetical protein A7E78_10150 [Syntrophotalea acetylenivorans]